jgi:hypothetical protein
MITWSMCVGSTCTGHSIGREVRFQPDIFSDDPPQHLVDTVHHVVQIDGAGSATLAPAERQQLVGESRGAVGCGPAPRGA